MSIDSFDQLSLFREGEDDEYIVEYILSDDSGFCHRASPFLMKVGTIFEHNYGTYEVLSIDRKIKNIIVYCSRVTQETPSFNTLLKMRNDFN